jgi:peptidoglycan/LPS O-acetylase OafA/YrhL
MVLAAQLYRTYAQSCCWSTSTELLIENLPGYLDIFAAGMIGAYLFVRWRDRAHNFTVQTLSTIAALIGFAFLAALLQNLWDMRTADQWSTAWAIHNRTLVACAFLLMGLGSLLALPLWQRTIANPILLFFAAISYNLYLYHQIFARELLSWRFPNYAGVDAHLDPHWQLRYTIVAFAVTIAQATIVTYAFERPLLRIPLDWWRSILSRKSRSRVLPDV